LDGQSWATLIAAPLILALGYFLREAIPSIVTLVKAVFESREQREVRKTKEAESKEERQYHRKVESNEAYRQSINEFIERQNRTIQVQDERLKAQEARIDRLERTEDQCQQELVKMSAQVQVLQGRLAEMEGAESRMEARYSKTPEGVITSWGSGCQRIFGWSMDEAVGQSVYDLMVPPDKAEEEKGWLALVTEGRGVFNKTTERVTQDGKRIRVRTTIQPIRHPSTNAVVGANTISRELKPEAPASSGEVKV
jgi:PAS domain S-box-containing protein